MVNVFADGFEDGTLDAWTSQTKTGGETVTVVSTGQRKGVYACQCTSNGTGGTENAGTNKTIAGQTKVSARCYVMVTQNGIADNDDRILFIRFRAGVNYLAAVGWRKNAGVLKWYLGARNGAAYVDFYGATPVINTWYCVELYWFKGAAGAGYATLLVNGVQEITSGLQDTDDYGNCDTVGMGMSEVYNCASCSVTIDDCIINDGVTTIGIDRQPSGKMPVVVNH